MFITSCTNGDPADPNYRHVLPHCPHRCYNKACQINGLPEVHYHG